MLLGSDASQAAFLMGIFSHGDEEVDGTFPHLIHLPEACNGWPGLKQVEVSVAKVQALGPSSPVSPSLPAGSLPGNGAARTQTEVHVGCWH